MASQNINQYPKPNWSLKFSLESNDMSLTTDEKGYNEEVVFSPYLIAQTYGNRLPFYFDTNSPLTSQKLTLNYKQYNENNIFVSQNYYNPENKDLTCFSSNTSCDIGLTGVDNGLVDLMTGQTIYFTQGLYDDFLKFQRLYFDRRLKLFQVTGHTSSPNVRFSGFDKTILYEVVTKTSPYEGMYHELYGGFYQGFYKLFGYDYDIFPERMNKGWAIEMMLKPRLVNEYMPGSGETTLNEIYPNNKNTFFYIGTRAENKFWHHADGSPRCLPTYNRVTSGLTTLETCACCNRTITNSRCLYVYPPRSLNNTHDPHVNYGCSLCNGDPVKTISCGCNCYDYSCETCGWECQIHKCNNIILPTPTPTVTPSPTPDCWNPVPACTPSCDVCNNCKDCDECYTGFTSIENTCEKDPLYDSMSNAMSLRLCGDPKNPSIGVRVLRFTGDCVTTGSCETTGLTYTTGYTIFDYCTTPIYPYCAEICPSWLDTEKWFQINVVWERYTWLDTCDLWYRGGLGDITEKLYLESLANNTTSLITIPYTQTTGKTPEKIELVNLNYKWLDYKKFRNGRLKIYVNGKIFHTIENFEELIPRALNTEKEKQVGVPFNISWGGGTQGLRENLTFSSTTLPNGPYIQDPECFPVNDLSGTTFSGMNNHILIEQNFAGTFEGGISQFRMYVNPLSAAEIKHNFNILKNTFRLFNPDCPDCTTDCLNGDFTYNIIGDNILISSDNYSGDTMNFVFKPDTENNVINLGEHQVPFLFNPFLLNPPKDFYGSYTITTIPGNCNPLCNFVLNVSRPTPTPTPTPTITKTPTPTLTSTVTPTPTFDPCKVPTPTPTVTITPTVTSTNTPTPTETCTNPCGCPEPSKTPKPTRTQTPTPTKNNCPSDTPTHTPTSTPTPTLTPTETITSTPTETPTNTPTVTPTESETPTPTPTETETSTPTPTVTPTESETPTPTPTLTPTETATNTPTVTSTPTVTPSLSNPLDGAYYFIAANDYDVCYGFAPSDIIYGQDGLNVGEILYQDALSTDPYTISELQTLLATTATTFYVRAVLGGDVFTITDNGSGDALAVSQAPCVSTTPTATPTNTPSTTVSPTVTPTGTVITTPTNTPSTTVTPTNTPSVTTTNTPTVTPSVTQTMTQTVTSTPTPTPTQAIVPSDPTLEIYYQGGVSSASNFNPVPTSGTTFTQWNDSSANAHNANAIGGGATRPQWWSNVQNGLGGVYFDGVNDGLSVNPLTDLSSKSGQTIVIVAKVLNTGTTEQYTQAGEDGNTGLDASYIRQSGGTYNLAMAGGYATGGVVNTNPHIINLVFNGSGATNSDKLKYYIDGVGQSLTFLSNVGTTTSALVNYIFLGVSYTGAPSGVEQYYYNGFLFDVLFYSRTLSNSELNVLNQYLSGKWGISVSTI